MRLLYSTRETYPTYRVDLTELFSNQLRRSGFSTTWHMRAAAPGPAHTGATAVGEAVHVGAKAGPGPLSAVSDFAKGLLHDFRLWRLIRRGQFDAVQVRDKPLAGLVASIACRAACIPFFYWMSFPYPEADLFRARDPEQRLGAVRRLVLRVRGGFTAWVLYKWVLPAADHVFVQSDRMLQDVEARGVVRARMTPVPMGIDIESVEHAQVDGLADPRLHGRIPLVYLGTMVRLRRIDVLLHAMVLIRQQEPKALLLMVGDAPARDMQDLRDECRRLGLLDHVIFTGFIPMEAGWSWVRAAAVGLSPCRPSPILDVGTPTKVIEYLAWGKPVVANHHPDQTAVIEASACGVLVDFSAEGFARGVIAALNDPALAARAAQRGREWVRQHRDYAVIARGLERRYRELIAAAPTSARHAAGVRG
ncbi:MAG: glycosyltransferase [Rubrivivax sp.]|nr:glycosyltransferase [Rubrivivax sp.]